MKRRITALLCLLFISLTVSAKEMKKLDKAIEAAASEIDERVPKDKVIAVLNIKSDSPALSNYIIDGLTNCLVKNGIHKVVDRNSENAKAIKDELQYQYSGEVNEETAQQIGYSTAAGAVVSGSIEKTEKIYLFKITAISVESREILVSWKTTVNNTREIDSFISASGEKRADARTTSKFVQEGISIGECGGLQFGASSNGDYLSSADASFSSAGCTVSPQDYFTFTGRSFLKYTNVPGFGVQAEFYYWNGGKEVLGTQNEINAAIAKVKYYSFDIPVMAVYSFPVFKTTLSCLVGVDISLPQQGTVYNSINGLGETTVSSKYTVIPGLVLGADYFIPFSEHFGLLIGCMYLRDFLPYTAILSDGSTVSAVTRSGVNFDAGIQFIF